MGFTCDKTKAIAEPDGNCAEYGAKRLFYAFVGKRAVAHADNA